MGFNSGFKGLRSRFPTQILVQVSCLYHTRFVSSLFQLCHCRPYPSGIYICPLTFWHRTFTFNSNKSPTWCNNFSVYYSDVCLQLNMFRGFSHPSSGAQWLQWQPLVLPSYRGDSHAVFGKTRGCHCSHWAPDDGRENARNMLSCK